MREGGRLPRGGCAFSPVGFHFCWMGPFEAMDFSKGKKIGLCIFFRRLIMEGSLGESVSKDD